jgi:cell division septum initiation protein DivIVA
MSFKGVDTFFDVLSIVKDPEKYSKLISQLQDETKQYTEAVEAVVAISEVSDYTRNIRENDTKAKQALIEAQQTAFSTIQEAKDQAKAIKDKAKEIQKKADDFASSLLEKESALVSRETKISEREKELTKLVNEANIMIIENTKLKQDLEDRKAKLMAAIG